MTRSEALAVVKKRDICLIHCEQRVRGECQACVKAEIDTAIATLRETGGMPREN